MNEEMSDDVKRALDAVQRERERRAAALGIPLSTYLARFCGGLGTNE